MNECTVAVGMTFVAAHGDKMNQAMTAEVMEAVGLSDRAPAKKSHKLDQSVGGVIWMQ